MAAHDISSHDLKPDTTTPGAPTTLEDVIKYIVALHNEIKPELSEIKDQLCKITHDPTPLPPQHLQLLDQQVAADASIAAEIDRLQSENIKLKHERDVAQSRVNVLTTEPSGSTANANTQERTAAAAIQEIAELKLQNSRLHSYITKQANNIGEVVDGDLVQAYGVLRSKVQGLAHQCGSYTTIAPWQRSPMPREQDRWTRRLSREVFDGILRDGVEEPFRKYRIQAALYEILAQNLLNFRAYPLHYKVEECLGDFERKLERTASGEKMTEFLEWRCRTVRCALWLQETSSLCDETIDDVTIFLWPLWGATSSRVPAKMQVVIKQLCMLAYELAMKTRQSTSVYSFDSIHRDVVYMGDDMPDLTAQDCEGERREFKGLKVSSTLFGGLSKYPNTARELRDRHVLDKAHVLLY